jgi:SOS-response transcriptional repressor LexA
MEIKDLVRRVNVRLEKLGVTHTQVSRNATGSTETIRNWMRAATAGKKVGVAQRTLEAVARELRTNALWLSEEIGPEEGAPAELFATEAPLVSWVSAGQLSTDEAVDEALGTAKAVLPTGDWIALRVDGESMDRISPPGSIIFVDRHDKRLVNGGFYVIDDGEGGSTYKRFRAGPMRFEPVSKNKDLPTLYPDNEPTIVGRVKLTTLDLT